MSLSTKENKYNYWELPKETDYNPNIYSPKKISAVNASEPAKSYEKSSWNSTGIWEQKHINKNKIISILNKLIAEHHNCSTFTFQKISDFAGKANILFFRNKVKSGFSFDFELSYQGIGKNKSMEGKIKIKNLTDYNNGEAEVEIISPINTIEEKILSLHAKEACEEMCLKIFCIFSRIHLYIQNKTGSN